MNEAVVALELDLLDPCGLPPTLLSQANVLMQGPKSAEVVEDFIAVSLADTLN